MTRKPVIFGNWKMNKTPSEAAEFMKGIEEVLTGTEAADYWCSIRRLRCLR